MIAITITPAAHQAIKASLLGTVRPGPGGLIRIWLARKFVDRLGQMRGPGESYSDMILRLTIEALINGPWRGPIDHGRARPDRPSRA